MRRNRPYPPKMFSHIEGGHGEKIMSNKIKNEKKGFIKLYRSLIDWEWFDDVPTAHLFVYCLCRANYENVVWQGKRIKKGSFVTSLKKLSIATGLSIQQVRTSLNKLKMTKEVTHQSTKQNTVITVLSFADYQESNTQITHNQHTINTPSNKQITTDKEIKNIERENRENFEILIKYAELIKAKSPIAYANKAMQSPNLDEVVKNIKIELENAQKIEEKKKKIEQEKAEEILKIEQKCKVENFSDSEILEELRKFNEKKTAFKSPIVKKCEKEAEKRGLKI